MEKHPVCRHRGQASEQRQTLLFQAVTCWTAINNYDRKEVSSLSFVFCVGENTNRALHLAVIQPFLTLKSAGSAS